MRKHLLLTITVAVVLIFITACQGSVDDVVGGFNQRATQVAGGGNGGSGQDPVEVLATETPEPTIELSGFHDLTTDPNALLVQAWGQTVGLTSGTEFTIIADQYQVAEYILQILQSDSRSQGSVRGGNIAIDLGQIRLDMALEDVNGDFGGGTITFQPTIDAAGLIRVNPRGADFASLRMPDEFTTSLGDALLTVLTGAPSENLRRVNLTILELTAGQMRVSGTVR